MTYKVSSGTLNLCSLTHRDVELNAGARDASSTCAITVTLTTTSKAAHGR